MPFSMAEKAVGARGRVPKAAFQIRFMPAFRRPIWDAIATPAGN
jgi:hypothetical protein